MDDYRKNGFISMGCKVDEDCVYYDENGNEIITFQSCRAYPSKHIPSFNSINGCICLNYIVAADEDEKTGRVYCTRSDAGSVAIYIFDFILVCFEIFIVLKCFNILLMFGKLKLKQLWIARMKRNKPISSVKRNGLFCLFLLMMNCLFYISYRILNDVDYMLGIRSSISRFRWYKPNPWPLNIILMISFVLLGTCTLHFTILWLSTTNALYSKEIAHNSGKCFNVIAYKRFINIVQISAFSLTIGLGSSQKTYYLVNFVIFAQGLVIIYEFVWGCRNITRLLRFTASLPKKTIISSNSLRIGIHESDTAAKLLLVADKIDQFSSKMRKIGFFGILFYGVFVVCQYFNLYASSTTSSNVLIIFSRTGDCFVCAAQFAYFNFLNDSLFVDAEEEKNDDKKPVVPVQQVAASVPALSEETIPSNLVLPTPRNEEL